MELQDRIIDHFHQSLDLKAHCIEEFGPTIEDAGLLLFRCLVSENKILCCGNGSSAALAQLFSSLMLNRYRQERPGLPAMALNGDSTTLSAIAEDGSFSEIYSKQIRALGQPGDVLLALSPTGRAASLVQAVQAAHDREMTVIALSGDDGGGMTALLNPEDIEICIDSPSPALVHEVHLLIIHALCDLIEFQLFGGID
ncbi:SIS domain-containing protein [Motiliproteus sp. SC1-56]|uniref:SIS domain-containing protein n=1 Tax=Motiliproteus sp. SC1-56 TaxID=2799565 RepID=UPI001A8D3382|nr:SIS domain-containing protein [Motiliproteus sp. SC1-56]